VAIFVWSFRGGIFKKELNHISLFKLAIKSPLDILLILNFISSKQYQINFISVKNIIIQRNWLFLATAIVLFMQSIAVWHDVSHPYHVASEQCEYLKGISHNPSLELTSSIYLPFAIQYIRLKPILSVTFVATKFLDKYSIRAPPNFS